MLFFLTQRRITKLRDTVSELRSAVTVGKRVEAKLVARLIGLLWSIQVVCHRAVTVFTRAMIRTLAVMLQVPNLCYAIGGDKFK